MSSGERLALLSPPESPNAGVPHPLFRRWDYYQLVLINLISNIGHSAYISSTFLLLEEEYEVADPRFLAGIILSAYAIAQGLFGLVIGRLADRYSLRTVLVLTQFIDFAANTWYALADRYEYILLARIVSGMASSNLVIGFGYINSLVAKADRGGSLATYMAARTLGFFVGPVLAAGVGLAEVGSGRFRLDQYTSPAWICAFLNLASMLMLLTFRVRTSFTHIKELDPGAGAAAINVPAHKDQDGDDDTSTYKYEATVHPTHAEIDKEHDARRAAIVLIVLNLLVWGSLACVQTISPAFLADAYGFGVTETAVWLTCVSLFNAVYMRIVGGTVAKRFKKYEQKIFVLLLLASIMAFGLMVDFGGTLHKPALPVAQYSVAFFFICIGLMGLVTLIPIMYGRATAHLRQGNAQARLQLAMAAGVSLAPLGAGSMYEYFRDPYLFITISGLLLLALLVYVPHRRILHDRTLLS